MAPAGGGVVLAALSLLYLCGAILSSEYFSTLTFFNSDLHKHGCSSPAEWEEYAADCESAILQLEDPDCEEGSNPPCESIFSLNAEKILNQAKLFVEQRRFPFAVENQNTNEELAIGYVLIGNGLYDEAIKHFSLLLQGDPELVSAIYGRGIAYGKKSLQDIKNADLALYELSRVIALEPSRPEVYEQRAEILSPLGRISEALSDLTKAIQLQPSARLYRHRGTLLFISEDYMAAMEDFQQSLELKVREEAIEVFKEALKLKSDFIDAYKSLGQAYRELGDFENAMESFQKALLLDQNHIQSLQLRGMMLYHHGSLQEAIGNFKLRAYNPRALQEVKQALENVNKVEDLLPIMKQFNSKTRDGFTVNSKVPSLKDPGKEYDGFTITITGDRVGNMLFSVETQTTDERTQQYQSEIEALYKDLTAKGKTLMLSTELGDADAVCNLILSLVYYFCNLMPLSRGSSVVAYSVVMGALMASGKEVLGRIPSGKLFDFEAMTTVSPDRFSKTVKSWMNLKSLPSWYQNLPSVSETFQLTRTMIEVLNTDSSSHCPKKS
ncbi:tetratricopeptide repeat protein 13-like [Sinocyclocheilus grahami]|uniref:tetratricopeptide repeat protein 13-like n=1 Tax=Sinocyclocheilus grahami TaxID=75366 RepID=UPI0007AD511F|nr:PREDICTED: tetratricopeptide repeat protein 13-like [Sinocyclocheilus grahami]